uniref:Uncharacterized protein n=1 Tax=Ascaris lumbricoides TaxID=6252 RepID=A0A0M3IVB7_ASCLU
MIKLSPVLNEPRGSSSRGSYLPSSPIRTLRVVPSIISVEKYIGEILSP